MKLIFITLFLYFQTPTTIPVGTWLHKEDASLIEIYIVDNELFGKLISSRNSKYNKDNLILRNFQFKEGAWKGQFYNIKNKRWMQANLVVAGEYLVIKYKYGFIEKEFIFHKEI